MPKLFPGGSTPIASPSGICHLMVPVFRSYAVMCEYGGVTIAGDIPYAVYIGLGTSMPGGYTDPDTVPRPPPPLPPRALPVGVAVGFWRKRTSESRSGAGIAPNSG